MFKAIKYNKIIAINETNKFPCLVYDKIEEDTEHTCEDYEQYNGEYLLKKDIPAPTREEQRQKRAEAYRVEKDPLTCQIQSLRDEEQTPEIEQEITDLIQQRADIVEEIHNRYPYPEE